MRSSKKPKNLEFRRFSGIVRNVPVFPWNKNLIIVEISLFSFNGLGICLYSDSQILMTSFSYPEYHRVASNKSGVRDRDDGVSFFFKLKIKKSVK